MVNMKGLNLTEQNKANKITEQKNYKFIDKLNTEAEQNGAKTTRVLPSSNIMNTVPNK
jgi:predicted peroxiredoxin